MLKTEFEEVASRVSQSIEGRVTIIRAKDNEYHVC